MTAEVSTLRGRGILYGGRTPNVFPVPPFTLVDNPAPLPSPTLPPKEYQQVEINGAMLPLNGIKLLLIQELLGSSKDNPVREERLLEILSFDGFSGKSLERRYYNGLYGLEEALAAYKTKCAIRHSLHEFEPGNPEKVVFLESILGSKEEETGEEGEELLSIATHQSQGIDTPTAKRPEGLQLAAEGYRKPHITLSSEDIELIVNPQKVKRGLDEGDIRILAALILTDEKKGIFINDLAERLKPDKLSGFAKEIASIPGLIDYYNEVVFKGSGLLIMPINTNSINLAEDEIPVGYYISGLPIRYVPEALMLKPYYAANMQERVKILKKAIRGIQRTQNVTEKGIQYALSSTVLDNGRIIAASINKGGESTKPVMFKDIEIEDVKAPKNLRVDEEGKLAKPPIYTLKAVNQFRLFSMLFQNEPVPSRILRTLLADDRDPISQRELQLYIDILNDSLSPEIAESLKKQGVALPDSLTRLGLYMEVHLRQIDGESFEECLKLSRLDDDTKQQTLKRQYDNTIVDEEIERTRLRRRSPSHAKLKI